MKKYLIVTVLMITLLGVFVPAAHANGCGAAIETPEPTASERTEVASIVLEGTVLSVSDHDEFSTYKATVQVHQYLKGNGPEIVTIHGFHDLWTLYACGDVASVGARLLFFAGGNMEEGLSTSRIGAKGSTMFVDLQIIAEIISVTGREPSLPIIISTITPAPGIQDSIKAIDPNTWTGLVILIFIGIVLIVGLGVILKKKNQ